MTDSETLAKKAAKAAYDREYRAKNREKITAAKKEWGQSEVKKAYDKKWAEDNRERSRAIKAAWKARNPDADKVYREKNLAVLKEKARAKHLRTAERNCTRAREWIKANPERVRANKRAYYERRRGDLILYARQREIHVLKFATPSWANRKNISEIYKQAGELGMHVDHVIPLRGKTVCGLHVENNLQLLTPKENMSKGNKYAS